VERRLLYSQLHTTQSELKHAQKDIIERDKEIGTLHARLEALTTLETNKENNANERIAQIQTEYARLVVCFDIMVVLGMYD
jgi:hypothetical protein